MLSIFQVELTKDSKVFIAVADKNQLKVDFSNQPKRLLMETLYILYGHDVFKTLQVTARGSRAGSYSPETKVFDALVGKNIILLFIYNVLLPEK